MRKERSTLRNNVSRVVKSNEKKKSTRNHCIKRTLRLSSLRRRSGANLKGKLKYRDRRKGFPRCHVSSKENRDRAKKKQAAFSGKIVGSTPGLRPREIGIS